MLISITLILAVAVYNVTPWVLIMLLITWVPDITITIATFAILLDLIESKRNE